jgi:hypothetical protein
VVEYLPSKDEILNSNPWTIKKEILRKLGMGDSQPVILATWEAEIGRIVV